MTADFDAKGYFQEVYRYNVDVWGFLTAYQDLLTNVVSRSYSSYRNSIVCQLLSDVLFKYCYSPEYAAKRIPVDQLADDLLKVSMAAGVPTTPERQGAVAAKKAKKKLVLRAASPAAAPENRSVISLPAGKKRCPTGYSKDPSDPRKCRKKGTKKKRSKSRAKAKKPRSRKKTKAESPERFQANGTTYIRLPAGRKRCPAGFKKVLGPDRSAPHVRVLCEKK